MIRILFIITFLYSNFSFSQKNIDVIRKAYEFLQVHEIDSLESSLKSNVNEIARASLQWEIHRLQYGVNDQELHKKILLETPITAHDSIVLGFHLGRYYIQENKQDKAYEYYSRILRQSKQLNDSLFTCASLSSLLELAMRNKAIFDISSQYVKEYEKYAYNDFEIANSTYYRNYVSLIKSKVVNKDSLWIEREQVNKSQSMYCALRFYQRVGASYDIYLKEKDSAIFYYNRALNLISESKELDYLAQYKKGIFNNLGCIYFDGKNYQKAVGYFEKAYRIRSSKKKLINDSIILSWLVKSKEKLNKPVEALFYYKKKDSISQLLSQLDYAAKIREVSAKYNFTKAENDKLILDKKRIINKNVYTILALVLTTLLIISIIGYRGLRRKQRLTESQKEFQKQKMETLLKEQELLGIDAMIEGQEKERQRIANDLHDNLGSLLTTLKLYIQNFKIRKDRLDDEYTALVTKTDDLLDEAYQEVRKMAHVKNAGVPSVEGLVKAVQNFASKISSANGLVIQVEDFGMELRIDSSMEIIIFRIIQELITNVVKHAEAKEVSVQLTHHKDAINIMIEDDGKGFEIDKITENVGMGLYSIKKRVEHVKGKVIIDSSIHRGTTVIIDIPTIGSQ